MTDKQESSEEPVGHTPHDSNPQMTVSVDFDAATPQAAGAQEVAHVSIRDASHPGIRAFLEYLVPEQLGKIEPIGFAVTHLVADRPEGAAPFGPGVIKDLPLARWDRVAQAAVRQAALERSIAKVSIPLGSGEYERLTSELHNVPEDMGEAIATPLHIPQDRRERAIEMVRRVRPDLDPEESRGAARSWNGLVKLAEALDEYMEILATGSQDPVGEMVQRHGVAAPTVRTWVHRARQAGLATSWLETPQAVERPAEGGAGHDRSLTDEEATGPADQGELEAIGRRLHEGRIATEQELSVMARRLGIPVEEVLRLEEGDFSNYTQAKARSLIRTYAFYVDINASKIAARYDRACGVQPTSHRKRRR